MRIITTHDRVLAEIGYYVFPRDEFNQTRTN